jgi:superfamily I DNA/RNA helicase/mRNA-degrading endonuclease RelE of RelBE toxin-antitoxin system
MEWTMTTPLFYQLIHKPTFYRQLLALPRKDAEPVIDKTDLLRYDPAPDAKNKKRIVGYKRAIFRIRAGNYRILYTFDANQGWVQILGVDDRKDVYRHGDLIEDEEITVGGLPDDADPLERDAPDSARHLEAPGHNSNRPSTEQSGDAKPPPLPLTKPLTVDLLRRLRVGEDHWPALAACQSVDDLIAAPVPETIRTLVFDVIATPDYDAVLDQPNLRVDSPDDFRRFYDGKLTQFLLQLDPEQQRFVDWARDGSGPTLVKGGPGTGKSIIALYRVRSLIAALRASGVAQPRILVTSYTNALVAASRQLLSELLGADRDLVTVTTVDKLVWDLLANAGALPRKLLSDAGQARGPIVQARERLRQGRPEDRQLAEALATLSLDFLLDEIDQVIVAREHHELDRYLAENRAGRGVRLTAVQRRAIWRLHEEREAITRSTGAMTFSQQRRRALELVRELGATPPYDGVVVDEAQDLEPTAIRLLVALCRSSDRLFLTADPNQAIYGSGFRWADVHADLQFRGRTGVLRKNYRSTRQIMGAAERYLAGAELESADAPAECPREGMLPVVRVASSLEEQTSHIVDFLRDATRELRAGVGACAVLVSSRQAGFEMAKHLTASGLAGKYMERQEIDLDLPVVKVMTRHSAKGLEFPIVAVTGFFTPPRVEPGVTDEQREEARQVERRIFYVAMTRAMDRLLVVAPGDHPHLGVAAFDPEWWDIGGDIT